MLSLGIEAARALSIAFWSARLAAGSGPPSLAATISARVSFVNSCPRFASAAPFLCWIDDHWLCPDMSLLPHEVEEEFVHTGVVGQLGVERGDHEPPLAEKHRLAVEFCQHLHFRSGFAHARRADEDAAQRAGVTVQLEVGLEARHLTPVGVAVDLEIDEIEVVAVEQDHPGARPEDRLRELLERLLQ